MAGKAKRVRRRKASRGWFGKRDNQASSELNVDEFFRDDDRPNRRFASLIGPISVLAILLSAAFIYFSINVPATEVSGFQLYGMSYDQAIRTWQPDFGRSQPASSLLNSLIVQTLAAFALCAIFHKTARSKRFSKRSRVTTVDIARIRTSKLYLTIC